MFTPEAFIFGFIQGFVIGPITLYGIREGLNPRRGLWFQLQVTLGATLVDAVYLILATNGMIHFLDYGWIRLMMWSVAAYMLLNMGIDSLRGENGKKKLQHIHRHKLQFFDSDFFKGFLMCMTSPMAITYAVIVVGGLYAGYAASVSPTVFALNVNMGGFFTSLLIVSLTFMLRHVFHQWMLKKLMMAGSLVLVGYGVYFSWKAILEVGPTVEALSASLLN
ncbi:MAG: LysE family transporter [Candidatus Gracilibacteria bacterium]